MIHKLNYMLHPGFVYSVFDGDKHYIGVNQLIELYGVDPKHCVVAPEDGRSGWSKEQLKQFIHLRPRMDGKYQRLGRTG